MIDDQTFSISANMCRKVDMILLILSPLGNCEIAIPIFNQTQFVLGNQYVLPTD